MRSSQLRFAGEQRLERIESFRNALCLKEVRRRRAAGVVGSKHDHDPTKAKKAFDPKKFAIDLLTGGTRRFENNFGRQKIQRNHRRVSACTKRTGLFLTMERKFSKCNQILPNPST
ncbi:hypothetical protein RB195_006563 [Necator americanus]|uniref:Uncharacterized protein n=1 Tax=Necator americanus TaxID=51031 RepID=A0ABR1BT80_NECAM